MATIDPTREQISELSRSATEGPIVMVNLLKFKVDGGRESYSKYSELAGPHLERAGGRVIYHGEGRHTVIGQDGWDSVLLVEYPSRKAFLDMVMNPEYQAFTHFRTDALVDSRLYCTSPDQN